MLNKKISPSFLSILAAGVLIGGIALSAYGQDPSGRPSSPSTKPRRKKPAKPVEVSPEEFTITLTVLTQEAGCEVYVNGELRGTSGSDGKFLVNKLPQGHYTVEVRKAGFVPSSQTFNAGPDTPTLVFKLTADLSGKLNQFDSLLAGGKLVGPGSPNALEIVEELGHKFPDRPEVGRIRLALAQKLRDEAEQPAKQVAHWREMDRVAITTAQMYAAKSAALNQDDKRAQALDLFFQGVGSLRDWQMAQETADPKPAAGAPADPRLTEAKDKLQKAVALQDTLVAADYQLGVVCLLLNDGVAAEGAFAKAAQLEPTLAIARIGVGDSMFAEGKRKDAVAQYKKAVDLDPNSSTAHAGLGLAQAMNGQSKDGLKEIEKAISLDPKAALPHYDLGLALADSKKKKDREHAAEELKKAIELNSKNLEFQNSVAQQVLANIANDKRK